MLAGDRASTERLGGHGNAIAAPYHHVILPLASRRDKVTEVRWGIDDFTRRFGRAPQGMWLPETAVDEETLDVLVEAGIRYTVLAPYQVRNPDPTGRPLRWRGANGRELALFTYDGGLAGEVAFGGLLRDPGALATRLAPTDPQSAILATVLATDGETFGHHHRGGDVTLARAIARIAARPDAQVHNFGSLLERLPPERDAELVAPSSWSCAHGVERWRSDCGCKLDPGAGTSQAWRGPLRRALSWLADEAHGAFLLEGTPLFTDDPWRVRDGYGAVVALEGDALEQYARAQVREERRDDAAAVQRARELLELRTRDAAPVHVVRLVLRRRRAHRGAAGAALRRPRARAQRPRRRGSSRGSWSGLPMPAATIRAPAPPRMCSCAAPCPTGAPRRAWRRPWPRWSPTAASRPRLAIRRSLVPIASSSASSARPMHRSWCRSRTCAPDGSATFQAATLGGHSVGVPRISLRAMVRGRLETPVLYDVRDFPELAARALLAPHALTPFPDPPFVSFQPR